MRRIIDESYATARKLLVDNIDKLHAMAEALIQYETLDVGQIDQIMDGRQPDPPADWNDSSGRPPGAPQGGKGKETPEGDAHGGTIGGPAGEH